MEMQAGKTAAFYYKDAAALAAVVVALVFTMRFRIAIFPFCNTCARISITISIEGRSGGSHDDTRLDEA